MKITAQAIITAKKTNDSKVRFKPNGIFWTANSENVVLLKLLNDNETLSLEKIYEEIAKKITDPELINAIGHNKFNDLYTKSNSLDLKNQKHPFHNQKPDHVANPIEVDICSSSSDEEVPLQIVEDDDDQVSKGKHKVKKAQKNVRNSYYSDKDLSPNNEWTDRTALIHGVQSRIQVRMDNNPVLKNNGEKGVIVEEPILEIKIPEPNIHTNNSKYLMNADNHISMKRTNSIDNLQSNSRVDHIKDRGKVANKFIDDEPKKSSFSINNENLPLVKNIQSYKEDILVKENINEIKCDKNQTKGEKHIKTTNDQSKLFKNSHNDNLRKDNYLEKNYTYEIGKNQSITGTNDKDYEKERNINNENVKKTPSDSKNNLIEIKDCKDSEDKLKMIKDDQCIEENVHHGRGKQDCDIQDNINEENILTGKTELLKSTEILEEMKNEILDYQAMLKAHMLLRDKTINDNQSSSDLNENLKNDNISTNLKRNEDNSPIQVDNTRKEDSFTEKIKEIKVEKKTENMNVVSNLQNDNSKDVNNKNKTSDTFEIDKYKEKSENFYECNVSSAKCIEKFPEKCNINDVENIERNMKNSIIQESKIAPKEIELSVPIKKEKSTLSRKPENNVLDDKEYLNISNCNDNVKVKEITSNLKNTHSKGHKLTDEKSKETKLNFSLKIPECYENYTILKKNEQNLNQEILKESISINSSQAYSKSNIESERKRKHSFNKESRISSNDKDRISEIKYKLKKENGSHYVKSFKGNNKERHKHHKSKDKHRRYMREDSLISKDKCKEVMKHDKLYKKQKYKKIEDKMSILDIIKEGIIENGQKLKNTDSYSKLEYKKENKKTKLLHSVFNNWAKCSSDIHKKNSSTSKDKNISNNINKVYNPTKSLAVIEKLHILKKHVIYRMDEIHGEIENVVWTRDKIHRKLDLVKTFIETDGYQPRKVDQLKRDSNDKVETVLINQQNKSQQSSSQQKFDEFSNKNTKSDTISNEKDIKPLSNNKKIMDSIKGETKTTEVNSISSDLNIANRKYKWKIEDIQKISKKIQSAKERIKRQMEILKGYMEDSLHSNEDINHIQEDINVSQNTDHLKDKEELNSNKKDIEISTSYKKTDLDKNTEQCTKKENDKALEKIERKRVINYSENNDNESFEEELKEDLSSQKMSKDFLAQFNKTMSEIQKAREDIQLHMDGDYDENTKLNNNSNNGESKYKILNIESEENKRPLIAKIILKEIRKVRKQLKEQRNTIINSNDSIFKAREKLNNQMKLMQLDLDKFQDESQSIFSNENIKNIVNFVDPTTEITIKKHTNLHEESGNENNNKNKSEENSCIQTSNVEKDTDILDDIESHLRYLDSTDSNEPNVNRFTIRDEKKVEIGIPIIQISKRIENIYENNTPIQSSDVVEGDIEKNLSAASCLKNSEDQNINEMNIDTYKENMESNKCEMKHHKVETIREASQIHSDIEKKSENEKENVDKIGGDQPLILRKSTIDETSIENQIQENLSGSNISRDTHLIEDSINIAKEEQRGINRCHSLIEASQLKDGKDDIKDYDQEKIEVKLIESQTKSSHEFEKDNSSTSFGNHIEVTDEINEKKDDDQEKNNVTSPEVQTNFGKNNDNESAFLGKDDIDDLRDDEQEEIDVTSLETQINNTKNCAKDDNSDFLGNQTESSDVINTPSSRKEKEITNDLTPIRKKRKLPPLRPIYEVNSRFKYLKKEIQMDSDITDSNSSDSNEVKDYLDYSTRNDGNIYEEKIISCDKLPTNIKTEFLTNIKEEVLERDEQPEIRNEEELIKLNLNLNNKDLKPYNEEATSEKCKSETDKVFEELAKEKGKALSETIKTETDSILGVEEGEKGEAVFKTIKTETDSMLEVTAAEIGKSVSETIKTETDSILGVEEGGMGGVVFESIKTETDSMLGLTTVENAEAVSERIKTKADSMLEATAAKIGGDISETINTETDSIRGVTAAEIGEAVSETINTETDNVFGVTAAEIGEAVSETINTVTNSILGVTATEIREDVPETINTETESMLGLTEAEILNDEKKKSLDKSELLKFKRENVDLAESNIYVSYKVIKRCPVCRIKVHLTCDKDNQMLKTVCFCGLTIYVLLDPDDEDNPNGYQTEIVKRRSKRIKNDSDGQDKSSGFQIDKFKRRSNRIKIE